MIPTHDLEICKEFKNRLRDKVTLITLKLFGSRSRGEAMPDSDFDFFVEVEKSDTAVRRTIRRLAWEVAFEHNTIFQTIIMTSSQLNTGPERSSLLVQEIEHEGISI
jgi:predicted nucleotidyltransferase